MTSWVPESGSTRSTIDHLEGGLSGKAYPAEALSSVDPADGKPLLVRYRLDEAARTLTRESLAARRTGGLWRWHEVLPLAKWEYVVSLGEGSTPLLPARRLGRRYGLANLYFKSESLNPTGSFKARGMAVAVSRAIELGATRFVAPSAG